MTEFEEKYDDPGFEYPIGDYAEPSDRELRIAIRQYIDSNDKDLKKMKSKCQKLEKRIEKGTRFRGYYVSSEAGKAMEDLAELKQTIEATRASKKKELY